MLAIVASASLRLDDGSSTLLMNDAFVEQAAHVAADLTGGRQYVGVLPARRRRADDPLQFSRRVGGVRSQVGPRPATSVRAILVVLLRRGR
jgi:hypothetical protein